MKIEDLETASKLANELSKLNSAIKELRQGGLGMRLGLLFGQDGMAAIPLDAPTFTPAMEREKICRQLEAMFARRRTVVIDRLTALGAKVPSTETP